jgi:hypothetical protein
MMPAPVTALLTGRRGGVVSSLDDGAGVGKNVATVNSTQRSNGQLVQDVAARAEAWGGRKGLSTTGSVEGTIKHGYADRLLNRYQQMYGDRGLSTEVRYANGVPWREGVPLKGAIRLDVVEGPLNNPTAVYDYKFGNAVLSPSRVIQIRSGAGLSPGVPVNAVHPHGH